MSDHEHDDEAIKLRCPVCGEGHFEEIYVAGKTILRWERQGVIQFRWNMKKTQAYRCRACDYVLLFAREKK